MTYLDTRDLKARLEELEDMRRAYQESIGLPMPEAPLDDEEESELAELESLRDDIGSAWDDGETMIPVDEFQDYARELADDIGAIPDDVSWPLTCIDWEHAASELRHDYTEVTWQGINYYVRSY
jgi:hypothetical protein